MVAPCRAKHQAIDTLSVWLSYNNVYLILNSWSITQLTSHFPETMQHNFCHYIRRRSTHTKSHCPTSSLKQVWEVHEPGFFTPAVTPGLITTNRDSQITRSKIYYNLIELQPLRCTPLCCHEFHALAFHPHPRFTDPLVGSTFRIGSEVCVGGFLREQPTC